MTTVVDDAPSTPPMTERAGASPQPGALSAGRLARWSLALFTAVFTVRFTIDPDLFWHLRTGEWILDRGIPRHDVFSFTVGDHSWVTHEWLTQVIGYSAWSVGGFAAVSLVFAAVGATAIAFTYHTVDGGPLQKAALSVATALVATVAFGARPQLFTLAFAAGFVWLVEKVRRGELPVRALWWAVPASLVWANLHSGFLLGVVILGTYAVGDAVNRRFWPTDATALTSAGAATLAKVTAACFAVAAVNPSGPRLWLYPFETLGSDEMRDLIAEWHSPNFHMATMRPFLLLIVGAAVVFAASRRRPTVTDALLFAGTVAAGLTSLRHIAVAAVVTMPVVARHLSSAVHHTRMGPWLAGERERHFGVARPFAAAVALTLAAVAVVVSADRLSRNDDRIAESYPVAAVDHIEATGLDAGNGYNRYGWGGYLIWRDIPVFTDGRADVYGEEFLAVVGSLIDAERGWEETFARYDIEWALVKPGEAFTTVLVAHPDWEITYEDDVAVVLRHVG